MSDSYIDGGLNASSVYNSMRGTASNAYSGVKNLTAKYSNLDTFKAEVMKVKEDKSTMFIQGTMYIYWKHLFMSVLMIVGLMVVFSLFYSNFTLFNSDRRYLNDPVSVLALVTAVVIITSVSTTMLLGKRIVKHTLNAMQ